MLDTALEGKTFESFSHTLERGKLREFLLAIGDDNPEYEAADPVLPPTFATTFIFWGGGGLANSLQLIGVDIWNVLHAEQEYEYLDSIHIGDTVTGTTRIASVYQKAGMDFLSFETEYVNQRDQIVLKDRALIIVREASA